MFFKCFLLLIVFSCLCFLNVSPNAIINMTTLKILAESIKHGQNGLVETMISQHFEEISCTDITGAGQENSIKFIRDQYLTILPFSDSFKQLVENGTDPLTNYTLCSWEFEFEGMSMCTIPNDWMCDGFSSCLTDECTCGKDIFKCADGRGCVTISQVCDSRPDCLDYSDECICLDYQQCIRPMHVNLANIPASELCLRTPDCSNVKYNLMTNDLASLANKLYRPSILPSRIIEIPSDEAQNFDINPAYLEDCQKNDTIFGDHCNLIEPFYDASYKCTDKRWIEAVYDIATVRPSETGHPLITFVFCDGVRNCNNGVDEKNCPYTFYCKSDGQPIPLNRTCDLITDCPDSSDECNNCETMSYFSSQTDLIASNFMASLIMVEIIGILLLNVNASFFHIKRFSASNKATIKVDAIQCLTLIVYDIMMSLYLTIISWKHWQFKGVYCSQDVTWRSSLLCKLAGALFYTATHGALQVAVATSICRAYICRNALTGKEIKLSVFIFLFSAMNIFNAGMATVPLIATYKISTWTSMFVHEFFFQKNPILRRGKTSDLASIVSIYKKLDHTITLQYSTTDLLAALRNMTSEGDLFSPERISSVGLYGTSSACYPDLFSREPAIIGYKVIYMIENSIYILIILISYILIVSQYYKSRARVNQDHNNEGKNRENNETIDQAFFLSCKVSILIISQLISWVPINMSIFASFTGKRLSRFTADVMIINISPLTALLNPVIHTDLFKRLMHYTKDKVFKITNRLSEYTFRVEVQDQELSEIETS